MNFILRKAIKKTVVLCSALFLAEPLFAQDGLLDPTFGTDGIVLTPTITNISEYSASVALQSNGKIVVGGIIMHNFEMNELNFGLRRYHTNGSIDMTFGTNGLVIDTVSENADWVHCMTVQSDDKIILAGYISNASNNDFVVVRYNPDGTRDDSFGDEGVVITDIAVNDEANAIVLQPDGKIVIAGTTDVPSVGQEFCVIRYNADGSLDETFDEDGIRIVYVGVRRDEAFGVTLQDDNKIVVVGTFGISLTSSCFAIVRCNEDGSIDESFGNNGVMTTVAGTGTINRANAVKVQPDGKIVVGGYVGTPPSAYQFAMVRYNADGTLDENFGNEGRVTTLIATRSYGCSILLQSDNKIIFTGYCWGGDDNFAMVRYNVDGSLDNTFGSSGIVITDIDDYDQSYASVLQSDGKIILAGSSTSTLAFSLARYTGTIPTVVIPRLPKDQIIAYPVPVLNELTIELSNHGDINEIQVLDSYGKIIYTIDVYDSAYTLNLEHLHSGVYMIKVLSRDNGQGIIKVNKN